MFNFNEDLLYEEISFDEDYARIHHVIEANNLRALIRNNDLSNAYPLITSSPKFSINMFEISDLPYIVLSHLILNHTKKKKDPCGIVLLSEKQTHPTPFSKRINELITHKLFVVENNLVFLETSMTKAKEIFKNSREFERETNSNRLSGLEQVFKALNPTFQAHSYFKRDDALIVVCPKFKIADYIIMLNALPTLFPEKYEITVKERNFLNSILTKNNEVYLKEGNKYLLEQHKINFKNKLQQLAVKDIDDRIHYTQQKIEDAKRDIVHYETSLNESVTRHSIYNTTLDQLFVTKEAHCPEDATDLTDFLYKVKGITKIEFEHNGTLIFNVIMPLTLYSDSAAKMLSKTFKENSASQKLFNLIFIEKKYMLRASARLNFNPINFTVAKMDNLAQNIQTSIPNPHLDYFNCFGSHRSALKQYSKTNDKIGAISKILDIVGNVNFTDSAVMSRFKPTIQNIIDLQPEDKLFINQEGKEFTYKEIIENEKI